MHAPSSRRSCDTFIWWLIAAMAASCLIAGAGLGFRIYMPKSLIAVAGVAALVATLAIGKARAQPRLTIGARAFLQMTVFTLIGVVLSYVLAARGGALWDDRLRFVDRLLGLDWPRLFDAADRLGHWLWLGGLAYHSLTVQMIVCIVLLSATYQAARLRVAVAAAVASGFVTILISGAMPALGNVFDPADYRYLWPSVAWMEQAMLSGLRDGSWRAIDLTRPMGIVTFPSYHATLPIILTWAIWRTPRWRVVSASWSTLTIAATPLFGGHYAIDIVAGAGLAALALYGVSAFTKASTPASHPVIDRANRWLARRYGSFRSPLFPGQMRDAGSASGADDAMV
jgi:hypothetical protein